MILNSYAVLDVFLALLRLGLGVLVLACGAFGWQRWHGTSERRENAGHLALLLAITLVLLAVAAWPLLYLLLQSYVLEWPGAMCIYGVTQVGKGSSGPAGYLPNLIFVMQWLKPALVFAGGAWYVIHLLDRRTPNAALLGRVFALLIPLGGLAVADAAADLTYVAIPKKEEFASSGCCTAVGDSSASRYLPPSWVGEEGRSHWHAAYFSTNIVLMLILGAGLGYGRPGLLVLPLAALNLTVSAIFLVEVVAPALLHLPFHHCAYDLIPDAPEGVAAAGLHLVGTFATAWSVLVWWLGRTEGAAPHALRLSDDLARLALWCLGTSFVMVNFGLVLA
jgi:hypothetical protein